MQKLAGFVQVASLVGEVVTEVVARGRVLQLLQYQHTRTLSQDEAVKDTDSEVEDSESESEEEEEELEEDIGRLLRDVRRK